MKTKGGSGRHEDWADWIQDKDFDGKPWKGTPLGETVQVRRCNSPRSLGEVIGPEFIGRSIVVKRAIGREIARRWSDLEFQVGSFVLLKVSPWEGVIRNRGKPGSRYIGPYRIISQVGKAQISGTKSIQVGENCKTRSTEARPGWIRGAAREGSGYASDFVRAARLGKIRGAPRRGLAMSAARTRLNPRNYAMVAAARRVRSHAAASDCLTQRFGFDPGDRTSLVWDISDYPDGCDSGTSVDKGVSSA
ncbi:hypothetical protein L2E82_11783 [Cichorium intybus]|uniref:Uncharacterized protein n=1 Tax=Cichorium intybus TaxID=13427 RepID=A0ACB9GEA0_CICIN|nr:hypothetical protein L2E82_11783 [Cichorium intybus]